MSTYLIIADDFTGANDSGFHLKRLGKPTFVTFQTTVESVQGMSLVIDTESRNCSEEQAVAILGKTLSCIDLGSYDLVMKKIDSTLRGNIAREVKALDALYGSALVLVVPALPSLGRTTFGGRQYLNGIPILETEHAREPIKPVVEDNLVSMFSGVYDEPITMVSVEQIRSGSFDFPQSRIVVCDAETDEDMRIVIKKARSLKTKVLYVGTSALSDQLCKLENPSKPSLALIASLNSVTLDQVRYAQSSGVASVLLPIADLLAGKENLETYIGQALTILREGKDLLVVSSGTMDPRCYESSIAEGELRGFSPGEVSHRTRSLMGKVGKALVEGVKLSGVVVSGGDTAMGLMESLSAQMIEILGEISLGIPLTRLVGGPHEGLEVITKAGGFGEKDAILFALHALQRT